MPGPTIAQRIVRAKRTLAEAKVPFEVPRGAELAARLSSVLEVLYLIFNEGYTATAGDAWTRARVGPSGEPVLLLEQDRGRWDQLLIRRGLAALERAMGLGGAPEPVDGRQESPATAT